MIFFVLFCLLPTTKISAQNMYLNNKSNRNNYFFVMFSITVSMKNKWKISTSLVYVLVIMDNRYNNSNIFSLFSVFLMTQNFLQFSCFSKKRFKNDLSNFFVSMHRLLGGVRWQVSWGSGILLLFSSCVLTRKIKTGC